MARPDRTKWAKNTTQMQVAVLANEDGLPVKAVRAHDGYFPKSDPNSKVSSLFALAGIPEVYSPNSKSKLHLKCANPSCKAKLHYVPAHGYENDFDGNRAHFRSARVSDHVSNCMFKNPERERDAKLSLTGAITADLPVFVNIHFDTGFAGNARIGSDYLSDHMRWKSSIGAGPHAVVPAHDIHELIKLRDRIAGSGEDKLANVYYGKNTMVLTHEHFWLAPQTEKEREEARDTTGRPDTAPYMKVLREILEAAEKPVNRDHSRIHGMTRIVAFRADTGNAALDAKDASILHGKPMLLRGASMLRQDMHLNYLNIDGYGVGQSRRAVEELLRSGGKDRRFLVAASPSIEFSRNPMQRVEQIRTLRAIVNNGVLVADAAKDIKITWHVDDQKQMTAQPFPLEKIDPKYAPGTTPYGEWKGDMPKTSFAAAAPAERPRAMAAERKPDVVKSTMNAEQLKLL